MIGEWMTQQRLVLASVGAVALLALGLFVWALQPEPFVPPAPPTRAVATGPKPKRVRTPLPPPVEIPEGAVDEALLAVAAANDLYRVRCSIPGDVTARAIPLRYATWNEDELTMVVASPSGRVALRDVRALPGRQTAGHVVWSDVEAGKTGACAFEPAGPVTLEVVLTGLEKGRAYKVFVCDERTQVDVVNGRATLEIAAHDVCMLQVRRVDEFNMPQMFTSAGNMIPVRPVANGVLDLEIVDKADLSADELDAINARSAADAASFMQVPARPAVDLDAVLQQDLTPGARAWLERQRR